MSIIFDFTYFWTYVFWAIVIITAIITFRVNKYEYQSPYARLVAGDREKRSAVERLFWVVVFGVFAAFPATMAMALGDTIAWHHVAVDTSWSRPIESLGDGAGVEGRFYLGSGYVSTSPVYMYYLSEPEGYRLYHPNASQSYITYTNDTPQMVVHFKKSGNLFWSRHFGNADDYEDYRTYEFQVPRGSVKQQFNLDSQ